MTDSAYRAKIWLRRYDTLERDRRKAANELLRIEAKVNNCVTNYGGSSSCDQISEQETREDFLLLYSSAAAELERITNKVIRADLETIHVIDKMPNGFHRAILTGRYINRYSMAQMVKCGQYELKKSQLIEHHNKALEELAAVLDKSNG